MADEGVENTTGSKIFVAVGEATTIEEYGALDWEEVLGVVSMGEFGDTTGDVSEMRLGQGRVIHTNGALDGGDREMSIQHLTVDGGRELIKTHGGTNQSLAIRRQYPSGDVELAFGVFTPLRSRPLEGESIRGYLTSVRVNSNLIFGDATAWTTASGG